MVWRIEFDQAAKRELLKLDPQVARRILAFLNKKLLNVQDPRSLGEALRGSRLGNLWKYRVGDYRVIANIEDNVLCILVVRIGNRRQVYW